MEDRKFEAILTILVPQVVQLICKGFPRIRCVFVAGERREQGVALQSTYPVCDV